MAGLVPRRIVRLWAWLLLWAHGFVAQMLAGVVRRPLRWLLGLIVGMPPRPGDTSVAATWLTRVLREKKVKPHSLACTDPNVTTILVVVICYRC